MRNFGNDSLTSQHYLHHHHHQLAPPPHQHLAVVPAPVLIAAVPQQPGKMEPYPMTKSVGVGTNLKQHNKSHFSPVSVVAPSPHHQTHLSSSSGHHNCNNTGSSGSTANDTGSNGIPINLSHGHHHQPTIGTVVPSSTTATTNVSHLPTTVSAAPCPTSANRGHSPTHQQIPVNGLPYHPPHSPTLPVTSTALPSDLQSNSGQIIPTSSISTSPNHSSPPQIHSETNSPYNHHPYQITSFHKMQQRNNAMNASASPTLEAGVSNSSSPMNPTHESSNKGDMPSSHSSNGKVSPSNSISSSSSSSATRMVSQNVNGTIAVTGVPKNESELQLFRVLQRANLLSYFDMMIELGGDDVQQMCEAGEHEFLEIMALIGMAAKPLHVRRFQKALQEWMNQPSLFQLPLFVPGYPPNFGVSQIDRTISQTQYTTTTITSAAAQGNASNASETTPGQHPLPVMPIPHLVSHNPISPYPAHTAPSYVGVEQSSNGFMSSSSNTNDTSSMKLEVQNNKIVKSHQDRNSNNNSPSLSNAATNSNGGGLQGGTYIHQGSPSTISLVIPTPTQSYSSGQQSSNFVSNGTATAEYYQNCPSPSGSTSSRSSTVSIRSHHQFPSHHHQAHVNQAPSSPMENSPGSPANSESGRYSNSGGGNNKHEEPSNSSELENASCSDHTNSIQTQTLDNSSGTSMRVARGGSCCSSSSGASSTCGSEPNSPAPPTTTSFSKLGMLISQTQQTAVDSPRPSTESVTNRTSCSGGCGNNSVTVPSSQDFSSLQEHEIQKLAETAMNLVRSLPSSVNEPKLSRKIETSNYETVLRFSEDDPRKMDEIRRLSAIFGKSDHGKRSKGSSSGNSTSPSISKPVSILELATNEAAAQLCRLVPALLTKRDEMFSLAKQVIRDSGLPYTVICANSNLPNSFVHYTNNNNNEIVPPSLKGKIDDIRNSPAHEERISHEFAAACKKIKLDIPGDVQDMRKFGSDMHAPRRKSPTIENNIVTKTALKRMESVAQEYRRNQNQLKSTVSLRT